MESTVSRSQVTEPTVTLRAQQAVHDFATTRGTRPYLLKMHTLTLGALAGEWGSLDDMEGAGGHTILGVHIHPDDNLKPGVVIAT